MMSILLCIGCCFVVFFALGFVLFVMLLHNNFQGWDRSINLSQSIYYIKLNTCSKSQDKHFHPIYSWFLLVHEAAIKATDL